MKNLTDLQDRLQHPANQATLTQLAQNWYQQTIEVKIEGYGNLWNHPDLLSFIRRAWGSALMQGASQEALNETPCPWQPPCPLNVFFFEQIRQGKHGLPKPFVIHAERNDQALILQLTIFGMACEWTPAANDRLIDALRNIVSWNKLGHGQFLPKFNISNVRIATVPGLQVFEIPGNIEIEFITPMDAMGHTDLLDTPHSIIARLARRVDGLALWQGIEISDDWAELTHAWKHIEYSISNLNPVKVKRWSARRKTILSNDAIAGSLFLSGDLQPIWPLLLIGQHCHIGRGAVSGQGRYHLL